MLSRPVPAREPSGPRILADSLVRHHAITRRMARRDIVDRYRGSVLGLAWSFFNPVAMLLIYTFAFSVVLGTKWPGSSGGNVDYAINLFAGMIVFSLFSEPVTRAPSLVLQNANLVKRVVFPLEVLGWMAMASSAFHATINYLVLLAFVFAFTGKLHAAALLFPLAIVPVALMGLGVCWLFASLGVFLRDLSHTVGLAVTALMFLSPVFYPLAVMPEGARRILQLNPLARSIEQVRAMTLQGTAPDAIEWLVLTAAGVLVAWAGLWWFMRTKRAFADVL